MGENLLRKIRESKKIKSNAYIIHNSFRNKYFPFPPSSNAFQRNSRYPKRIAFKPEIPPLDNTATGALKKKKKRCVELSQTHPNDTSTKKKGEKKKTGQHFWLNQDSSC